MNGGSDKRSTGTYMGLAGTYEPLLKRKYLDEWNLLEVAWRNA